MDERTDADRPSAIDPATRHIWRVVAIGAAAVAGLLILRQLAHVVLLVFAGILLAVFLRGCTDLLHRRLHLSRHWGFALVLVGFLLLGGAALWYLVPTLADAIDTFSRQIPAALERLRTAMNGTRWAGPLLERFGGATGDAVTGALLGRFAGFFSTALGALTGLLIVLVVGIYAAAEPRVYENGLTSLFPPGLRPRAEQVLKTLRHALLWWILGRLMSMAVVAGLTWLGLLLLGMPLAFALALIAGLLSFIPNIGPILAAVPAVFAGLVQGPWMALYVVGLYIAVQTVESYLITPLIQRRTVAIAPAFLITAQFTFGALFGFLGILLATPATVALMVLVKVLYIENVLGEW